MFESGKDLVHRHNGALQITQLSREKATPKPGSFAHKEGKSPTFYAHKKDITSLPKT
jgi:hypothetical protein